MDFDETGTDRKLSMWPTFWDGSGTSWGPFKPDWVAMEVMGGECGGMENSVDWRQESKNGEFRTKNLPKMARFQRNLMIFRPKFVKFYPYFDFRGPGARKKGKKSAIF